MAGPDTPPVYDWLVQHRRLVLAFVLAIVGLIILLLGWWGVSGTTVVADQLAYLASGGVGGLAFIGLSSILFWAEQRQRELDRLGEIEAYLGAIAAALGLTEDGTYPNGEGSVVAESATGTEELIVDA